MADTTQQVSLRVVDEQNVKAVMGLAVRPDQDQFVAPNAWSLGEAFATTKAWARAIYADEVPVGFVMLFDDPALPRYYLWRFMIDADHQRSGFGRQAMALVHEYVRTRPGGDTIFLSYVPADGGPEEFYKSLGYVDTGVEHGGEREAVLALS
jgi:diamine N-acetyltransferase